MSAGPASAGVATRQENSPQIASSAAVLGTATFGTNSALAEGAIVRSTKNGVAIGTASYVIENSVVVGNPRIPVVIGRRTVFGHRCLVIGATVGDFCEIGNGSVLMPGATVGDRVFLGEGTVVPAGMAIPDDVVAVGRPARIIRAFSAGDLDRLRSLRGGDLSVPAPSGIIIQHRGGVIAMGQLHAYRSVLPIVAATAVVFPTAEITGDVVVGERSIIGAGVKIIGDSNGPVRIGNDVQILENTVLHLLPNNDLVIEDGATVGPGAMIHGCHIGPSSVIEPGAIVCDGSVVGPESVVRAGSVVKQRSQFGARTEIDGQPAAEVGRLSGPPALPAWALDPEDLPDTLTPDPGR
jgi:carbonic anhydrase/acetyltransferase-like protein (isoleucine patch superfamily)